MQSHNCISSNLLTLVHVFQKMWVWSEGYGKNIVTCWDCCLCSPFNHWAKFVQGDLVVKSGYVPQRCFDKCLNARKRHDNKSWKKSPDQMKIAFVMVISHMLLQLQIKRPSKPRKKKSKFGIPNWVAIYWATATGHSWAGSQGTCLFFEWSVLHRMHWLHSSSWWDSVLFRCTKWGDFDTHLVQGCGVWFRRSKPTVSLMGTSSGHHYTFLVDHLACFLQGQLQPMPNSSAKETDVRFNSFISLHHSAMYFLTTVIWVL